MAEAKIRLIRIEGDIAYVPLSKGMVAIIDAADVPLVDDYNWNAQAGRNTWYAVSGVAVTAGRQITVQLHRLILSAKKEFLVDHEDGNGLNCRRANLRLADRFTNAQNRRMHANNKVGLKGVIYIVKRGKWRAQITANRKTFHLGMFDSPEAAHDAYAQAAKLHHGVFAKIS